MKSTVTLNYYSKIKALLPAEKFKMIDKRIIAESNLRLEAFWNILIAGYSVDFSLANYIMLYEYVQDKPIEYSEALVTYANYPKLNSGIYIIKTKWFELN
ncbi:MAG TPA: hypothetical protein VLQ91_07350 [Draconibacterium sp.]|jgi:predicted CDP-diglyceride synthetase/phosphatidate cytidylyltransferase|nr:hypothetical protein [Draconibacterium sp.]